MPARPPGSPGTGTHPIPAALRTTNSYPSIPAVRPTQAVDPARLALARKERLERVGARAKPARGEAADKASRLVRGMLELRLGRGRFVLPILPAIATKLITVLESPDLGVHEVSDIVSSDAGVAAKLVQVANSPVFAGVSPVKTVPGAIVRLGIRTTYSIVTAASLQGIYVTPVPAMQSMMLDLFSHSFGTAVLARAIAVAIQHRPADEAYLAGLLHDIACPLILRSLGEIANANGGIDYDDGAVAGVLDQLHLELGGLALEKWELPADHVYVARNHDTLTEGHEHTDLNAIVFLANVAAKRCGFTVVAEDGLDEKEALGCAELGITAARFEDIKREAQTQIERELLLLLD